MTRDDDAADPLPLLECDGDDHPPARPRRAPSPRIIIPAPRCRSVLERTDRASGRHPSRPTRAADRRGPPPRDRPREEDSSRGERRVARSTLGSSAATLGSTLGSRAPNALDRASRPKMFDAPVATAPSGASAARGRRGRRCASSRSPRSRVVARGAAKPRVGASSARVQSVAPRSSPGFAIVRFLASIAEGARRRRAVA